MAFSIAARTLPQAKVAARDSHRMALRATRKGSTTEGPAVNAPDPIVALATLAHYLMFCPLDKLREPKVDDLVLEVTKFGGIDPDGIGWLRSHHGQRWVVEPLSRPGEEQGWQNAVFLAVPDSIAEKVKRAQR